jgi:hypothetical protein
MKPARSPKTSAGQAFCQSSQGERENGLPEIRTQDQSVKKHLGTPEKVRSTAAQVVSVIESR